MTFTLKKGTQLKVPMYAGVNASSSAPSVCNATVSGDTLVVTAVAPGDATLRADLGGSLAVMLKVKVEA